MPIQAGTSAEHETDRPQTRYPSSFSAVTGSDASQPSDGAGRPSTAGSTPAVIIVEGDAALAEMLDYSIRNAGHTVHGFRRGQLAIDFLLEHLRAGDTPVVLLDLDLLGSEGFLALKQIADARPGMRIIVLSAQGAERDQIRALRAGAIDYLVKPLSIPVLIAKVERLLRDTTR